MDKKADAAIVVILVVILAIALYAWTGVSKSPPTTTSAVHVSSTTQNAVTMSTTSIVPTGGPGNYVMSKPQMSQLVGGGGTYSASENSGERAAANYSAYNVSDVLLVVYSQRLPSGNFSIFETVYLTDRAASLYNALFYQQEANASTKFGQTNLTQGGLDYSYYRLSPVNASRVNGTSYQTYILGTQDGAVVVLHSYGNTHLALINIPTAAIDISTDLP